MIHKPNHPQHLTKILSATPARLGVGHAGGRPLTTTWLKFRLDHAKARDAVHSELSPGFLNGFVKARGLPVIQSQATSRNNFILQPPLGKRTSAEALESLKNTCPINQQVQIVISDGLSANAVEKNIPDLLPMLEHGLALENISFGLPVVVRFARVAIADQIGHALGAKLAINLIGERPGLSSALSLSAYLTYNPRPTSLSSERTVVSNIHAEGTPAVEAGAYIVQIAKRILETGLSGVRLQQLG